MKYEIKEMPVSDLKAAPYNPRTISEVALKGLQESIRKFGLVQPIIFNRKTNRVVGGHQRLKALEANGDKTASVILVDWDELTEKEANLTLNNPSIQGEFTDGIVDLLDQIKNQDKEAFEKLLLSQIDVDAFINANNGPEDDAVPAPPKIPKTKMGDLFKLGKHRLLCGNSAKDLPLLMGAELADLVFTDPPYNVNYEGKTDQKMVIKNDNMGMDDFIAFLEAIFGACRKILKDRASLYVCHPSSYQREIQGVIDKSGFEVRNQIIWVKNHFAWGMGRYKFQHEPIFYAHIKGKVDAWYGDKSQSTAWLENKPIANRLHPTMKPVELILRALRNSSRAGDIVLDLFGGAGSTLIAAEKMGRSAYIMEIDPIYCDVIIKRWEEFTNLKAQKIN